MPIQTTYSRHLAHATLAGAIAGISATLADEQRLRAISDADAGTRMQSGKWSRKEILGHLIDSAANNTQRFVRAQIPAHHTDGVLLTPGYEQDDWVRVEAYQRETWHAVIDLWLALNRHILHILDNFDSASLGVMCAVGSGSPEPIEHIIVDYAGHLIHHYRQITGAR